MERLNNPIVRGGTSSALRAILQAARVSSQPISGQSFESRLSRAPEPALNPVDTSSGSNSSATPSSPFNVSVAGSQTVLEQAGSIDEMDFEMEDGPASFLRRWLAESGLNNDPREVFRPAAQPVTTEERFWCWCRANRSDPKKVFAEQARRRCAEILRFQLIDGRWLELHILSSNH